MHEAGHRQKLWRIWAGQRRQPHRCAHEEFWQGRFAAPGRLGIEPLDGNARHHLLEILQDRESRRSTLATRQLPLACWFDLIGDPTSADVILDRLVHNAHRLELSGHPYVEISLLEPLDQLQAGMTPSPND